MSNSYIIEHGITEDEHDEVQEAYQVQGAPQDREPEEREDEAFQ